MLEDSYSYYEGQKVKYRGEHFDVIAVSLDQSKIVIGTEGRTIMVNADDLLSQ